MKCPLLAIGYLAFGDKKVNEKSDCLKKGCAWWSRGEEQCGFLALAHDIHWMKELLIQVRDKMPHGEES